MNFFSRNASLVTTGIFSFKREKFLPLGEIKHSLRSPSSGTLTIILFCCFAETAKIFSRYYV